MLKKLLWIFGLLLALDFNSVAWAQNTDEQMTAEQFLAGLKFQEGAIDLPGGIAVLNLPDSFRYLGPEDSDRLLSQGWGNPPGMKTLGMILPAGINPLAPHAWGVVVTYEEDGHVNDSDADSIDYTSLLKDMQDSMLAQNEERAKQGYPALNLVGWAENPTYDKASHKLYWAKELAADNAPQHSLNYNIRVLGRKGVLVLNAVAGMSELDTIKAQMQHVVSFSNFTSGNAYADFNESTDQVAAYGLAALVAGGAAAKLGVFAKLIAMAIAFKKAIILAFVGIGVVLKNFFGRKKAAAATLRHDEVHDNPRE